MELESRDNISRANATLRYNDIRELATHITSNQSKCINRTGIRGEGLLVLDIAKYIAWKTV